MALQFDCPICEEKFLASIEQNNSVQCPCCSHKFSNAGVPDASTRPTTPATTPSVPTTPIDFSSPDFDVARYAVPEAELAQPEPANSAAVAGSVLPPRLDGRNHPSPARTGTDSPPHPQYSDGNQYSHDAEVLGPNGERITTDIMALPGPSRRTRNPLLILSGLLLLCGVLCGLLYLSIAYGTAMRSGKLAELESGDAVVVESSDEPAPATDSNGTNTPVGESNVAAGMSVEDEALNEPKTKTPSSEDNAAGDSKVLTDSDAPVDKADANDSKPAAKQKMKEPKFSMIRQRAAEMVWDDTQPFLVGVKVDGAFGTVQANGLIVDSRGWLLTSYSACLGAKRIRVTAAVSSTLRLQSKVPLTDLVRGVIAVDPKNDLVLLEVNRRFTTLNQIKTAGRDFTVKGRRLIQCTPPTPLLPFPICEVQVSDRGKREKLRRRNQSAIAELNSNDLIESPMEWIVHSVNEATFPGSPLIDESGVVQAMHVFRSDKIGYAVPIVHLHKLIGSADGEASGLEILSPKDMIVPAPAKAKDATSATEPAAKAPIDVAPNGELDVLQFGHPLREASLALNLKSKSCDKFEWAPKNRGQYVEAQAAIESFYDAKELLINHANDEAIHKTLTNQLDYWTKRVLDFQKSNDDVEKMVEKTNSEAASVIRTDECFFMAFAQLEILDVESELLIFRVVGTDCYVSFPFDEKIKPMLPSDTWLLFGKTPPAPAPKTREVNGEAVTHHAVHVFHQLGKVNVE